MQIMGDRLTQFRQAAGRQRAGSHRRTAQLAGDNALPQRTWKRIQRRHAQLERLQHALRLQRIGRHRRQRRQRTPPLHGRQLRRDIGACLPPALQNLRRSVEHRRFPPWRAPRPDRSPTRVPKAAGCPPPGCLGDGVFDSQINLPVQRFGEPAVQTQRGQESWHHGPVK